MQWSIYFEPVKSNIETHSFLKNHAEFGNILICPIKKIRTYLRTQIVNIPRTHRIYIRTFLGYRSMAEL